MSNKTGLCFLKLFSVFIISAALVFSFQSTSFAKEVAQASEDYPRLEPGKGYLLAPGMAFDASYRSRAEFKSDFKQDAAVRADDDEYLLQQLRMSFAFTPEDEDFDWFGAFVEIQDSRVFFSDSINTHAVPTLHHDQFDVHQLYIDLKLDEDVLGLPVKVRTGRQKMNFGSQRLIGALEWVNTARVWDAVRVTIGKAKERTLDWFSARAIAVQGHGFNDWGSTGNRRTNSDFHGLYYTDWLTIPNTKAELYWLFRHDDRFGDTIHSLGSRFETKYEGFDIDGEATGQHGEWGNLDHAAFASHIGFGYTFDEEKKTRIGISYNFASGDADPADSKHNTFDNLYPTNHKFYGYMDFFSWQNIHNIRFSAKTNPMKRLTVTADYHLFWLPYADTDAWYNVGGASNRLATRDVNSYAGSEIDLLAKYAAVKERLWFMAGYSHFFPGRYVDDTGKSRDADFFYLQTKIAL